MRKQGSLVIATSNAGKIRELRRLLRGVSLRIDWLGGGRYPNLASPRESGDSFVVNARLKASHYARQIGKCVFSEDSGLCVPALGGLPGIRSARFLGAGASDAERCVRVLHLLEKRKLARERAAYFEAAGAISDCRGTVIFCAKARCRGWIAHAPRGENGFGYDPIFYYPPAHKTFAQMAARQKNRVSHRGLMIAKLRRFLSCLDLQAFG